MSTSWSDQDSTTHNRFYIIKCSPSTNTANVANRAHAHWTNFLHCALFENITQTISTTEEVSNTFYSSTLQILWLRLMMLVCGATVSREEYEWGSNQYLELDVMCFISSKKFSTSAMEKVHSCARKRGCAVKKGGRSIHNIYGKGALFTTFTVMTFFMLQKLQILYGKNALKNCPKIFGHYKEVKRTTNGMITYGVFTLVVTETGTGTEIQWVVWNSGSFHIIPDPG